MPRLISPLQITLVYETNPETFDAPLVAIVGSESDAAHIEMAQSSAKPRHRISWENIPLHGDAPAVDGELLILVNNSGPSDDGDDDGTDPVGLAAFRDRSTAERFAEKARRAGTPSVRIRTLRMGWRGPNSENSCGQCVSIGLTHPARLRLRRFPRCVVGVSLSVSAAAGGDSSLALPTQRKVMRARNT